MRVPVMERRLVVIAVAVALVGATSGYALGGFATGGTQVAARSSDWWSSDASTTDTAATASPVRTASVTDDGPKHYTCRGCGPTLAQRRVESLYTDHGPDSGDSEFKDLAPIPSYRPAPVEGDHSDATHTIY